MRTFSELRLRIKRKTELHPITTSYKGRLRKIIVLMFNRPD